MIYTSSYNNWHNDKYKSVSVSGNRGMDANYQGEYYPALAPKKEFWQMWHNNIGKISEEENNHFYIKEYYEQVLKALDPYQIYQELDNKVLLCYEDNLEFCHRHIIAAWLELNLGISVLEVKGYYNEIEIVSKPSYIKEELASIIAMDKRHKKRRIWI